MSKRKRDRKSPAGAGAPAGGDGAREAGRFSARRKTDAIIHCGGTGGPGRGSTREIRQRRRRPLTKRTVSPVTYPPRPRGAVQIKGLEEPVSIYEVEGIGPLRTKLQVAVRRGLARFVGRQREMESLQNALAQAKAGHGQLVGVMGEPGVGKSRLFYEFKRG
jgi:hypothetical protein